ncbi:MAG: hypothetical protein ABI400_00090 [Lacisediminihabitans sp.]
MAPAKYDEAKLVPLTTSALIEARVADLLGRAVQRQLWLLFLDENDVQLPLLVPLEGLPSRPPDQPDLTLQSMIRHFRESVGAHSFVFVLERYADATLTPPDIVWARALHRACDDAEVVLRGILVSHKRGVRWVAQDDYRFGGDRSDGGDGGDAAG